MRLAEKARRFASILFGKRSEIYLVKFDAYWHPYIPYAFLHIGSLLKRAGFSYKILHNVWREKAEQELELFAKEVIAAKPLWVGLSVITGRSTYFSARFSRIVKENSDIPIVWGGIHPTILPQQCLEEDYVDYVILGEGEERAVEFTHCLLEGKGLSQMDGIGYKRDGQIFINPPKAKVDVRSLEIDWDHDLSRYLANGGLSYITSRGCPYRCDFCVNNALDNRKWRPLPEDKVLEDISYLKWKYNISYIHFNDDNFFVDQERAFRILNWANLRWFAETRVNYITENFAKRVKEAGECERLMAGGESGSERVLKLIHKGHTRKQMLEAARLIGTYKIPSSWSFIVGMPGEAYEDIRETFEFMRILEDIAGFPFCKPGLYMPYPGTLLYQRAIDNGFSPPQSPEGWIICERYRDERRPSEESMSYPWIDIGKLAAAMDLMREDREAINKLLRE